MDLANESGFEIVGCRQPDCDLIAIRECSPGPGPLQIISRECACAMHDFFWQRFNTKMAQVAEDVRHELRIKFEISVGLDNVIEIPKRATR
jgi:hypothetical protein